MGEIVLWMFRGLGMGEMEVYFSNGDNMNLFKKKGYLFFYIYWFFEVWNKDEVI